MQTHQMTDVADIRKFVLAGNATLTLKSKTTGNRFTVKVHQPKQTTPHFVKVLTGPEDYTFLGSIFNQKNWVHSRKSVITGEAMSAKAFKWFWTKICNGQLPESLEVWHEGRCCRCGRELTVPESITLGWGPECAKLMGKTLEVVS